MGGIESRQDVGLVPMERVEWIDDLDMRVFRAQGIVGVDGFIPPLCRRRGWSLARSHPLDSISPALLPPHPSTPTGVSR